jgi:hypothetical protein
MNKISLQKKLINVLKTFEVLKKEISVNDLPEREKDLLDLRMRYSIAWLKAASKGLNEEITGILLTEDKKDFKFKK